MKQNVIDMIRNSDMVLVGIGEEFEGIKYLKKLPEYGKLCEEAQATGRDWLVPAINRYFARKCSCGNEDKTFETHAMEALNKLAEILTEKNYFLITITTNDYIWNVGFKESRIAAPCGGSRKKQCSATEECSRSPEALQQNELDQIEKCIQEGNLETLQLGNCEACSSPMILNNIYTEKYDERGYLDQWQIYTKWLQGTLNKKLCILELGVGMQCPSVIRFPFEKIGYFNQKADFIRVNQNLYHLTEELKEKGVSISENAVDWLTSLW